ICKMSRFISSVRTSPLKPASSRYTLLESVDMICGALEAVNTAICTENVVTKVLKFLADLAAYEAEHKQAKDPGVPQIKGRTALVAVLVLLLFLAGFTYLLTSVLLSPRAINR